MCYPDGEFRTGEADVHARRAAVPGLDRPVPFYMSGAQFEYWKHTHLTIDVVPGRGSGFSVEAPEGVRFLIRSRLLTEARNWTTSIAEDRELIAGPWTAHLDSWPSHGRPERGRMQRQSLGIRNR